MVKNQISNAVLFFSRFSNESKICVTRIREYNLPIQLISLDNPKLRELVKRGKMFQITSVPTLLIEYISGDVQLFTGRPKILQWASNLIDNMKREINNQTRSHETTVIEDEDEDEDEDYTELIFEENEETPKQSTSGLEMKTEDKSNKMSNVQKMAEEMKRTRDNMMSNNQQPIST